MENWRSEDYRQLSDQNCNSMFTFPFCVGISFLNPTLLSLDKSDDEDLTLCELSRFIFLLMNATRGL